jgi:hypothetical protein
VVFPLSSHPRHTCVTALTSFFIPVAAGKRLPAFRYQVAECSQRRDEEMREPNLGHELKDMAQEVVRFGERCVQAGRNWLNERREEMNHRNDDDRRYQNSQTSGVHDRTRRDRDDQSDRSRAQQAQASRDRGEYYGGEQFDDRSQRVGWGEGGDNWDYEGGPERYGASGYAENAQGNLQAQAYGRQYGAQSQFGGRREYGSQNTGASDYYRDRQGHGSPGSSDSEYSTYGRHHGEATRYARSQPLRGQQDRQRAGRPLHGSASGHGGESAGLGGRGSLFGNSLDYLDDGEMSGYRGHEPGRQPQATPGHATRAGGFRGVGPRNYVRSDQRLTEDINERLTDDDELDASDISVRVSDGRVTLEGRVDQRWMKHRAEDIADSCTGVKDVDNRIHVASASSAAAQRGDEARATGSSRAPDAPAGTSSPAGGTTSH